jgi:hypothetical protein
MMGKPYHYYTPEEIRFVKRKIAGRSYVEMTALFNERFGLRGKKKITFGQMQSFLGNHKLSSGRDCRFRPGLIPHNKGKKGHCPPGSEKGWFKPGEMPYAWRPVGTEIVDSYGYVKVKIRNPRTWKFKHRLIWEKAHGKVPRGHVILFADGNKLNVRLDNLLLISRKELAVMNRLGLISAHKDLTKIGKSIADIKLLIAERKQEAKKAQKTPRNPERRQASRPGRQTKANGGTGGKH